MAAAFARRSAAGLVESAAGKLGDMISFWGILAFGVFLLFVSSWIPAARTLRELRLQEGAVQAEIKATRDENARLENRLNALYNDPYYVERILRNEMGFLPPGEIPLKPVETKNK